MFSIIARCEAPTHPLHGFMENVPLLPIGGSNFTFRCKNGYKPSNPVISVCTDDAEWYPDPMEHTCILVTGMS